MVTLLVLRIWLADLLARCQYCAQCAGIHWRTTLHVLQSSCICVARRGDLFVWRASDTDNASVRKTVQEHGSKESLTKIAACLSASVSALYMVQCFPVAELAVCVAPLGYWMMILAPPSVIALVAEPSV